LIDDNVVIKTIMPLQTLKSDKDFLPADGKVLEASEITSTSPNKNSLNIVKGSGKIRDEGVQVLWEIDEISLVNELNTCKL
jgi:hypothetical protein